MARGGHGWARVGHRARADPWASPHRRWSRRRKGDPVFTHTHALQYEAKPDGPDPDFARKMQEILGGQWGEMTVATQYLLQGWNCR
ncbi:MAG TPA: manganese catalase family protein, partial [Geodermatophilus sp.]|nr:manganese catalase family protein [Geodermatophilus sp.]